MTLIQALTTFINTYHSHPTLVAEQHDWHCTIALLASDTQETITLYIQQGRVVNLFETLTEVDLLVTATAQVLYDILEFRRDPNEPYLFGELTVQGPETHFLRLDYIVTQLCL